MKLESLMLENWRSYKKLKLDFSSGDTQVLVGPNGAGKTNILEAISVLSLTKSCLGAGEDELVTWDKEFFRATGLAVNDEGAKVEIEVVSQFTPRRQKVCFINGVKKIGSQVVGQLPTVTFLPQDLDLFSGSPAHRRTFLDRLLCQVSPEYLQAFGQYTKLLKQRNALLKAIAEGANRKDLDVWDKALAEQGSYVSIKRLELIEVLQCSLADEAKALGENDWSDAKLVYERYTAEREHEAAAKELEQLLRKKRDRDIALQATTVGPHREDWSFTVSGRNLSAFASRGQQRTAVLTLLFLQVSYLELARGEKPIVLLDDVFSELDDNHQGALLKSLKGHQVLITSTRKPPVLPRGVKIWEVADGKVTTV